MVIPCIDLQEGCAVQLVQGKERALTIENLSDWIDRFESFPVLQLIDLDAAMGVGNNRKLLQEIIEKRSCRVGGGIRSVKMAHRLIDLGANSIILGSAILSKTGVNLSFLKKLTSEIDRSKIILALDSREGKITTEGWKESLELTATDVIEQTDSICGGYLATYVDKEGKMEGTDLEWFKTLRKKTKLPITAAGGISSYNEIQTLSENSIDAAIGMAIYTQHLDLKRLAKM